MTHNFKVTSDNRGKAKRLLNVWQDSHLVRKLTLSELQAALVKACNDGLTTGESVHSALRKQSAVTAQKMDDDPNVSDSPNSEDSTPDDDVSELDEMQPSDVNEQERADAEQAEIDSAAASRDVNLSATDDDSESENDSEQDAEEEGDSDSPPPLDSEQPFVTHPELEGARKTDREHTAKCRAQDNAATTKRMTLLLKAMSNKVDKEKNDKEFAKVRSEMDAIISASPKVIEVKLPDSKETIKVDSPHKMFELILSYVGMNLPVMLIGPAGCGKTYLTEQVSKALELAYHAHGAMLTKFDILGFKDASGKYHSTPAYEAYVNGGLHVFDELDASNPEAVVAFNGLTDGQSSYAWPNGTQARHAFYRFIACANTYGVGASAEYVGRFAQDAAVLNRFLRVYLDYDRDLERSLVDNDIAERGWSLRDACAKLGIKHVVSTRSLVMADKMRKGGISRKNIDDHCFFAGLSTENLKQISAEIKRSKAQ